MQTVILYVEDEPNDIWFMTRAFDKLSLSGVLRSVGDGRDAIAYLGATGIYADRDHYPQPVMVLLDLNLPVISGFEVLKWLKGRPELQGLPVVVFSSSVRAEDETKARALGAVDYITKPQSSQGFIKVAEGLKEQWLVKAASA